MTYDDILSWLKGDTERPVPSRPASLRKTPQQLRAKVATMPADEVRRLIDLAHDAHHESVVDKWAKEPATEHIVNVLETAPLHAEGRHLTIVAVDIVGFGSGKRTRPNYVTIRNGLAESMKHAFKEADIPWSDCFHENTGDGRLILAPASVPKTNFAAVLPHAMDSALRQYNDACAAEDQIKLRLALHAGEVTADAQGFAGIAVTHAFRLLDAAQLKAAMADSPATLGVIASDWFFDDVIRHRPEHEPNTYHKVRVEEKETSGFGWIRLVGHEVPAGMLEPVAPRTVLRKPSLWPATPEFFRVVDALEKIPCLQTEHSRSLVLEQLTFAGAITYFPNRRAHLTSILRSCFDHEDGIVQLLEAVTNLESIGWAPVKRLLALKSERQRQLEGVV